MKKGDIITVVSIMTPEIIALFYAADMMGATLNLIEHPATASRASVSISKGWIPTCWSA